MTFHSLNFLGLSLRSAHSQERDEWHLSAAMPRRHYPDEDASRAQSSSTLRQRSSHEDDARSLISHWIYGVPLSRRSSQREPYQTYPQGQSDCDRNHRYNAAPSSVVSSSTVHPYEIEEPDGTLYKPRSDRQHGGGHRTSALHESDSGRHKAPSHTSSSRARPAGNFSPPLASRTSREPYSSVETRSERPSRSNYSESFTTIHPRTEDSRPHREPPSSVAARSELPSRSNYAESFTSMGSRTGASRSYYEPSAPVRPRYERPGRSSFSDSFTPTDPRTGHTVTSSFVEKWECVYEIDEDQCGSDCPFNDDRNGFDLGFSGSGQNMQDRYTSRRSSRQTREVDMYRERQPYYSETRSNSYR